MSHKEEEGQAKLCVLLASLPVEIPSVLPLHFDPNPHAPESLSANADIALERRSWLSILPTFQSSGCWKDDPVSHLLMNKMQPGAPS